MSACVCISKFVIVCVIFIRHSENMITKLRSAGLGFYVKESETLQRLGKNALCRTQSANTLKLNVCF